MTVAYAELQATTNFTFLRGASHPGELVQAASALGLRAVAVTDRNTLAGVVRAHAAARETGMKLVVGARLDLADTPDMLCLPRDRAAYGRLSRLLTTGRRRAPKGECEIGLADLLDHAAGQILIVLPPEDGAAFDPSFEESLVSLRRRIGNSVHLAASHLYRGDDRARIGRLAGIAARAGTPLVATNDVHAHTPARRRLADVLTCIRERCTIDEAGYRLAANAERHLKPASEMMRLFRDHPDAVRRTVAIAEACDFSLDELRYEYPDDEGSPGDTPGRRAAASDPGGRGNPLSARCPRRGRPPGCLRARPDRRARLRGLFPDRPRHRPFRAEPRDPVPGPRVGGQLGGLLLPRHHRGRPEPAGSPVRALRQRRA